MEIKKSLITKQNQLPEHAGKKGVVKSGSFSHEINEAWELYREQLQRNFELMKVISEQQRVIEQFVSTGLPAMDKKEIITVEEIPVVAPAAPPAGPELQFIPYDRIVQLVPIYKKLVAKKLSRNDALANHLNMLYILWQLEEATPEKWFMQICVPESTAYRYATLMRRNFIIKSVRGKYMLSSLGRMLMEGKAGDPAQQEELLNKAIEESGLFTMRQHNPAQSAPGNKDFLNQNYRGM